MNDSASDTIKVDTARLPLLLRELRLPTIAAMWQSFTERADREGWPAARLLATLTELELAERDQRRIQRHLIEARLPPGKTLDSFDFAAVPMLSRAHVVALATGDGWIDPGGTILLFGLSGSGKSTLSAAFGHALIENGYRVLFTRTTNLVQRLQQARQALSLESAIEKLDKYHLLILASGRILAVLRDDIRRRQQSVRRVRRDDQTNPTRLNTHFLNGLLRVLFTSVPSALRSSSLLIPGASAPTHRFYSRRLAWASSILLPSLRPQQRHAPPPDAGSQHRSRRQPCETLRHSASVTRRPSVCPAGNDALGSCRQAPRAKHPFVLDPE